MKKFLLAYPNIILYKIYKHLPSFVINFPLPRAVTEGCFPKQNRKNIGEDEILSP